MDVILTSRENHEKLIRWLYAQPIDVIRGFPVPKELIVPVEGLPRCQIEELLSDNPDKYRKDYAAVLNVAYYESLYYKKPAFYEKEWYVSLNPYDAQLFDAEMYAEGLREVTGDNRWRFDKTGYHQNGNGKVFCFIKEE